MPNSMSATTISYATTSTADSNAHKRRSSLASANLKLCKLPPYIGKWKRRPAGTTLRISIQEESEARKLLKCFKPRKQFSLPSDLPNWSPPAESLSEISAELSWCRDYSDVCRTTSGPAGVASLPRTVRAADLCNGTEPEGRGPSESPRNKLDDQQEPLQAPTASTSSPRTSHAPTEPSHPPTEPSPEAPKPPSPKPTFPESVSQGVDVAMVNGKGKGKALAVEIDWSDWQPQAYVPRNLAELRYMYADRAKELKRSSERHMREVHHTYERAEPDEQARMDRNREIAVVQLVDSLLLFTQSFLCQDLDPSAGSMSARRPEFLMQWESMVMFLAAVKGASKRSKVEPAYAICVMYEGLLLHRLAEGERPLLLQQYGHVTEPEKQLEAYKKFKAHVAREDVSKQAFTTAQALFQRLFATKLPKLRDHASLMKPRITGLSPDLMSLDGEPWRFSWPIERDDGLGDFVAFARAALEEWLEKSGNPYRLERFDDRSRLFKS